MLEFLGALFLFILLVGLLAVGITVIIEAFKEKLWIFVWIGSVLCSFSLFAIVFLVNYFRFGVME